MTENSLDNQKMGLEYTQLCENMRHYGNQRFAILTFFISSNALIFSKFLDGNENILLIIAGLTTTIVFWIVENRAADFYAHFRNRAKVLENDLRFEQFSGEMKRPYLRISATKATSYLYYLVGLYWLVKLLIHLYEILKC